MKLEYAELKKLVEILENQLSKDSRDLEEGRDFLNTNRKAMKPEQIVEFNVYLCSKDLAIKTVERLLSKATEHIEI